MSLSIASIRRACDPHAAAFDADQGRNQPMSMVSVSEKQAPLRAQYSASPDTALVTDWARTTGAQADDPFHAMVEPMPGCGVDVPVGVHRAVGGPHDAPTPGDILCAALAACQDSTYRMVANLLGVELEFLAVEVTGNVDVRGTLAIDSHVPVGFQSMRCDVRLRARPGTKPELMEKLKAVAERCCIVRQTLLNGVVIEGAIDA
jgi:uncharacterized OsmC-like protein